MNEKNRWSCEFFKDFCPIAREGICSDNCFFQASLNKLKMGIFVLERGSLNLLFSNNKANEILSDQKTLFLNFLKKDLKRVFENRKKFPVSGSFKCENTFFGYTCYELEENCLIVFFKDITERENMIIIHQNKIIYEKYNKMISQIIHEIGNPIAGIMSVLQITQINFDEYTKEEIGEKLNLILNETKRLREILNLLRPLGADSVSKWSKCNLQQLLFELTREYNNESVSITWGKIPSNVYVFIRKSDFKQVVDELIKNTEKFAGKGARITVNIVKDSPFYLKMIFEDNGPGIPEELLEKIFSPFFTTSPSTSKGMGLTIARKRMLNMGGMIFAEENKGKGARFVLYLPLEGNIYELFNPVGG